MSLNRVTPEHDVSSIRGKTQLSPSFSWQMCARQRREFRALSVLGVFGYFDRTCDDILSDRFERSVFG